MVPASAIAASIQGSASYPGGQTWALLAQAIGNALSTWAVTPGNILVQGVSTGVVGAGTVTGFMQLTGGPALVVAGMSGGGLTGTTVAQVGTAIGTGLISSLSGTLTYQGISTGVGSGLDVSFIPSVNSATLASALQLAHVALTAVLNGTGSSLPSFYTAIATGIASLIQTGVTLPGTGIVVPSGPLAPGSSVGTTISFLV